ncbi:MAG: hypothetical protein QXH30_00880, partial [Candidatus Bilamarchaeaceae archaeon]
HEIPYEISLQGAVFRDKLSYVKGFSANLVHAPLASEAQPTRRDSTCPVAAVFAFLLAACALSSLEKQVP